MTSSLQRVASFAVAEPGSGYAAGDCLRVAGGRAAGGREAAAWVAAVGVGGAVAAVSAARWGQYEVAPPTPNSASGGRGRGCALALTFSSAWQSEPWVVLAKADLRKVLSDEVLTRCNRDLAEGGLPEGQPVDPASASDRATAVLAAIVARLRAAVRRAYRVPLSATPGSVPPEAETHVLTAAAWRMVNTTPNLQMAVMTDKGAYSPLGTMAMEAEKFFEDVGAGLLVTFPDDPDPSWAGAVRAGAETDMRDVPDLDWRFERPGREL